MLPAEKTHYRKGLTLGLTLAETFSVVVFVLLLAFALVLRTENDSRVEAEEQLGEAETQLARRDQMLNRGDTMGGSWYRYAQQLNDSLEDAQDRAKEAEAELAQARSLLDARLEPQEVDSLLEQSAELEIVRDSVERVKNLLEVLEAERDSLINTATEAQRLREIVADAVAEGHDSLTSTQVDSIISQAARAGSLAQELKEAYEAVRYQAAQLRSRDRLLASGSVDSLAREKDRWRSRSDSLERELRGHGPPSCWLDARGNPEHVFRVELTDGGMRLFATIPEHRTTEDEMEFVQRIEEGREYVPEDFRRLTSPFLSAGLRDECKFWVRIERRTEDAAIFEERIREVRDPFFPILR